MTPSRRDFFRLSLLASSAAGLGLTTAGRAESKSVSSAETPLKILVLGGTGLIGPPLVEYAVARGHEITLFNRGKTRAHLFPQLEKLRGDRADDLKSLEAEVASGRRWDAVIDNTAAIPRWVTASANLLSTASDYYLYTSSISAYAEHATPGADESAALGEISPEEEAKVQSPNDITGQNFGPLKARCEEEARKAFVDKQSCVVRPGLIVGQGDASDRFTYWPARIARGGEILAPGNPDDPVQFIDCRDLGEWYVRLVERRVTGIFNGVGPRSPMTIAGMLYGIRATVSNEISFTWVPADFLAAREVQPWVHMTVWIPPEDEYAGFATNSIDRALDAGLTFRPLADTAVATLEYWNSLPEDRRAEPRAGCPSELERKVLAEWHLAKGS
jgi:2'-hydroxyisoflavone reductase